MSERRDKVTSALTAIGRGDRKAAGELLPLVYGELRRLARHKLAHEPPGITVQGTDLVDEAFLRLVQQSGAAWDNRGHFFAAAAEAMRRILIERARKYRAVKHGGDRKRLSLDDRVLAEKRADELVRLDEALDHLEAIDRRKSEIVKLRYFAGLSIDETATAIDVSRRTVEREWTAARAWLRCALADASAAP